MTHSNAAVRRNPQVMYTVLEGEAILLNAATGDYYSLNEASTFVWDLIAQSQTIDHVYRLMLDEFDVESERLWQDLLTLVHDLCAQGLAEMTNV